MIQKVVHRDQNLMTLIKQICERPQMYVGSVDFKMAGAFIDGFSHASNALSEELLEFGYWLGKKLKLRPNVVWTANLQKRYPNDEDAFRKLPELYEEFEKTDKNGWKLRFQSHKATGDFNKKRKSFG